MAAYWTGLRRILIATIVSGLLAGVGGCASVHPASNVPAVDATGTWDGQSQVTNCGLMATGSMARCNAINLISISLSQNGTDLSGAYHCSYGNMICRDGGSDDAGRISNGWVSGANVFITVEILSDGSTCRFNGRLRGSKLNGSYECYQGGGLVEEGIFQADRLGG
ncbi:MAG TPA: hypothetical protein VKV28_09060 [Candidatus Binataceae bacterium]|nr:hypothetical protein [Candidatus Binataceae bacterium]